MTQSRIREIRDKRGLTLDDLTNMSGVSRTQIYRAENEQVNLSSESLKRIAKALRVSMDYLSGLSDVTGDVYAEETLSASERSLILALREGRTKEALSLMQQLIKE